MLRNARHIGLHHVGHALPQCCRHQGAQAQHALVVPLAVGHHQQVGLRRQGFEQAQIAQHGADPDVGAHLDGVCIHQAPGRVFRVGQQGFQLLAPRAAGGLQQLAAQRGGQRLDQVHQVIEFKQLRCRDQVVKVEFQRQCAADLVMQIGQHLAGAIGLDHAPYRAPLCRRQRLQQPRHLGRVHALQDLAHALELAFAQGVADGLPLIDGVLMAGLLAGRGVRGFGG